MSVSEAVLTKKADLAGPGIGDYDELRQCITAGLQLAVDATGNTGSSLRGERVHRGKPVPGAQPDNGDGSADR